MATGSICANSSDAFKCADSEYPQTGADIWLICLIQPELEPFLCWNLQIFVTMATGVSLSNFWLSSLNRLTPKTPYWVQVYGSHLLCQASYSQFCVKMRNFSLPWQQGRSVEMRMTPLNVPTLNTHKLVQISGLYVLYNPSYCYFCAEICKFSLPWQQGSVWAISDCHL